MNTFSMFSNELEFHALDMHHNIEYLDKFKFIFFEMFNFINKKSLA